jgi:hypothetical protein
MHLPQFAFSRGVDAGLGEIRRYILWCEMGWAMWQELQITARSLDRRTIAGRPELPDLGCCKIRYLGVCESGLTVWACVKILDSRLVPASSLGASGGIEMQGRARKGSPLDRERWLSGDCMELRNGTVEFLYSDEQSLADELLQP